MIRIAATDELRSSPPPGVTIDDGECALDVDRYRAFLESVTGLAVSADPSPADCYRIGNRLEGFIASQDAADPEAEPDLQAHPMVDSMTVVHWLAVFFRTCHEDCRSADPAPMR